VYRIKTISSARHRSTPTPTAPLIPQLMHTEQDNDNSVDFPSTSNNILLGKREGWMDGKRDERMCSIISYRGKKQRNGGKWSRM
jgi:hypothetical protein